MKSRTLYLLVNLVGLAATLATAIALGLAVFGSVVEHRFRMDLFTGACLLFASAVALHVLWDIGTRLMRVEEAQRGLTRDFERLRDGRDIA